MVNLVNISDEDIVKYDVIFKRAEMLCAWTINGRQSNNKVMTFFILV